MPFVDKYTWAKEILAREHHTLIAGCSGSGKTEAMIDLLYTTLLQTPYKQLFVLIDTKRVSFLDFKDCIHCAKYVNDPKDVLPTFQALESIMNERFKRMEQQNLRRSSEPNIWVVIDEFFDLKTMCDKRVIPIIERLACRSRAVNIFLMCGTQRCTRDVINGVISANFSVKLGLRTVTAQESRNILQVNGCEDLPRYGKGILQIDGIAKEVEIPLTPSDYIEERKQYWVDFYAQKATK